MHRFISTIAAALALGTLSATAAADAAAPASVKNAPAATRPASATSAGVKAFPAQLTTTAQPAPAAGAPMLRKVVCLSVSRHCFAATPLAATGPANTPSGTQARAHPVALDLHAPDIRSLYSETELRKPLEDPYEEIQRMKDEQVKVEGSRPDPNLPIGILSLPWAVMHPTQAWRIFLPVPSAK
jgi:hypothetical protein